MPDEAILNTSHELFCTVIDTVKPDHFFTWDDPTYLDRIAEGNYRLLEIDRKNLKLYDSYPKYKIIGLVKGSTAEKIEEQSKQFAELGIGSQVFHTGDYFRGGPRYTMVANRHARIPRKSATTLMFYGIGSRRGFNMFRDADIYLTQSHYVRGWYLEWLRLALWKTG